MPDSNHTIAGCTGQCQSCPVAQANVDASVPQGWAQTLLWAVMFLGPLILAAVGAVWAGRRWDSQLAQVLCAGAGFVAGTVGAKFVVGRALKRHAKAHECAANDNGNG